MTKSEIVAAVYERVGGFSKKEAADIVELVFETVKETLGRGEKIKVFKFKRKKQYKKTIGHRQSFTELKVGDILV